MEDFKEYFEASYSFIDPCCYLVLRNQNLKFDEDEVKLLNNINSSCYVKYEINIDKAYTELVYDITRKIPLCKYMKIISKENEIINLLLELIKIIVDCRNFLLLCNNCILNVDHIYIDSESLKPNIIYVPVKNGLFKNFDKYFKRIMSGFINSFNNSEGKLLNIKKYLSSEEEFSIQEFQNYIYNIIIESALID